MKLYRTHYLDDQFDRITSVYDGTQADAAARRKSLKADGMRNIETKDEDVPTDKAGLITHLNGMLA